jgi:hypothetical protein
MPLFLWRWISHERKAVPRASAVPLRPERRYPAAARMAATGFGGRRTTRRRFHLRRRQTGRQQGLGGRAPREPCHLHRSRPEHEQVGALDESPESLERGHRLQVDRYLLGSPPGDRRRTIWISGPGSRAVALAASISGWIIFVYRNRQFLLIASTRWPVITVLTKTGVRNRECRGGSSLGSLA